MKCPSWMYRRRFSTAHSRRGFLLSVTDEWLPWLVADKFIHGVLIALGHPCCGRGLGRIPSERLDALWFRILNSTNGLYRHSLQVLELPLTPEQAFLLAPHWRNEEWITVDGIDEAGYRWENGVLVADPE